MGGFDRTFPHCEYCKVKVWYVKFFFEFGKSDFGSGVGKRKKPAAL